MIALYLLVGVGLLVGYLFYQWATKNNNYFINQTITIMKPKFLFGNVGDMLMRKQAPSEFMLDFYKKFPRDKIVGFFDTIFPSFFVRDPEIVKLLAVKNFEYLIDRRVLIDGKIDVIFGNTLLSLRGHEWKNMRGILSPAFTGSKMRLMFELISNCGDEMSNFLYNEFKDEKSKQIIEMKDLFSRISIDVIATCAFGIETNSLKNRNNDFYNIGERVTNFGTFSGIFKFIGFMLCPWLMKILQIRFIAKEDSNFFHFTISDTIQLREKLNIVRPDMINLLMSAKKGQLLHSNLHEIDGFATVKEHNIEKPTQSTELSSDDIVAQCFTFFIAGFDTVSTAMSFISYELALNPEIQEKLLKEIDKTRDDLQGSKLTYDLLQQMKYLDMVTSETLRKWPPAPMCDRVCVKDFNLTLDDDINVQFKKGDILWIPIYAFHQDPNFYPNPDKFDPERFSGENKKNINPLAYLPFGIGPRNCIGSRFALIEIKAVLYYILLHFTFEICEKTEITLKMGKKKLRMLPDNGIFLRLKPREM